MSFFTKKAAASGVLLALALATVSACTVETPQQKLAYCQQWSTWATEAPSVAYDCGRFEAAETHHTPDPTRISP
jgi:hypothetical protein